MTELYEKAMQMNDEWAERCADLVNKHYEESIKLNHQWYIRATISLFGGAIAGIIIGICIGRVL